MQVQNFLHDGKPQSRADLCAFVLLIDLIVAIPDVLQFIRRYTLARIANRYAHGAFRHGLVDIHGLVPARIVDGVVHKVIQHLRNFQLIGADIHRAVIREREAEIRQFVVAVQRIADILRQIEFGNRQRQCARL